MCVSVWGGGGGRHLEGKVEAEIHLHPPPAQKCPVTSAAALGTQTQHCSLLLVAWLLYPHLLKLLPHHLVMVYVV